MHRAADNFPAHGITSGRSEVNEDVDSVYPLQRVTPSSTPQGLKYRQRRLTYRRRSFRFYRSRSTKGRTAARDYIFEKIESYREMRLRRSAIRGNCKTISSRIARFRDCRYRMEARIVKRKERERERERGFPITPRKRGSGSLKALSVAFRARQIAINFKGAGRHAEIFAS